MLGFRLTSRTPRRPDEPLWDVHCHLLPAVDDGVADEAASLGCVEGLIARGYSGAVLTPHIYPEVFDNEEGVLRQRFEAFRAWLSERVPDFGVCLAAEYFCDDDLSRRIRGGGVLTFGEQQSCILIELPVMVIPGSMDSVLQACRKEGLTPVIAHIERYSCTRGKAADDLLASWRDEGALLQVNLGSLVGQYGRQIRRDSRRLLKQGWVDLLGTDLHGEASLGRVEAGWRWIHSRSWAATAAERHQTRMWRTMRTVQSRAADGGA